MYRFYLPSTDPEEWRKFLADPKKQWRTGFSARALAYSWVEADGFPHEIGDAFTECSEKQLRKIEFLMGFPEYKVPLKGGSSPSQNDLLVLAKTRNDLATITVEGKVSESFDITVEEWLRDASEGKKNRLEHLCAVLDVNISAVNQIRYQLLHRTASALIEAERFNSRYAIMLVHSFSQTHEWFEDYRDFTALYGIKAEVNKILYLRDVKGIKLFSGWVTGEEKYLSS